MGGCREKIHKKSLFSILLGRLTPTASLISSIGFGFLKVRLKMCILKAASSPTFNRAEERVAGPTILAENMSASLSKILDIRLVVKSERKIKHTKLMMLIWIKLKKYISVR